MKNHVLGALAAVLVVPIMAPALVSVAAEGALSALGAAVTAGDCATPALEMPSRGADTSSVQWQYTADSGKCAGAVAGSAGGLRAPAIAGLAAVGFAEAQIGTPYEWGGETVGVGFDCSGLAQAAWRAAGVSIPRVAQDQFDEGPVVPDGEALEPGDLVFFGTSASDVTHVGIVVKPSGEMVDAPHTGALVRLDPFPIIRGGSWGGEVFVGVTRPGGAI